MGEQASDVVAVVVAGGRGRRLGGTVAKPQLVVDGMTILARLERVLEPLVADVIVSTAAPVPWTRRRQVHDAVVDAGPLAGIAAAFAGTDAPWLLVVAGDLPFVAPSLVSALLARRADSVDAVVPWLDGHPEPLLALYGRTACASRIAARLAAGQLRVSGLFDDATLRIARLDDAQLRAIDPTLRSFRGINIPADLAALTHTDSKTA